MKARFLTFEGLDGSGKSTQLARAAAWLRARGRTVEETAEPGGTELGRALRSLFLAGAGLDGGVEALLVFAARRQHLLERIRPALAAGRDVLCDRFTDSTFAYQGHGRGVDLAELGVLDGVATGGFSPHATLWFDLPPELARRRSLASREAGRPEGGNRLDSEDLDFYARVDAGYRSLAAAAPERIHRIDADGSRDEVEQRVAAVLARLMPEIA